MEWNELQNAVKETTRRYTEALYDKCRTELLKKMEAEAVSLSKLASYDEEIYEQCEKLMAAYKETVMLYERFNRDIESREVREIIDGIITVLVSRLREFEEVSLGGGINPITEEKKIITAKALKSFEEEILLQKEAYLRENIVDLEQISEDIFPPFYEAYIRGINLCCDSLNDLERPSALQTYLLLMENELEILSTIIKIQVHALEQAAESGDSSALEKIAVQKILSLLREAYQHFGRASTEIVAVFHRLEQGIQEGEARKPADYDTFLKICTEISQSVYQAERANILEKVNIFKASVEKEADNLAGRHKLNFFKAVYRFRKMVNDELMLADEMVNIFADMKERWPKPEDDLPSEYGEILRGIAETIDIKIEGLKESGAHFKDDCYNIMEKFSAENVSFKEDELKEVRKQMWQLFIENQENFKAELQNIPLFDENAKLQEKNVQRTQDSLNAKLTKFKREILLYEVSTYEEIIFYSVSRLRSAETEHSEPQAAAKLADETLNRLDTLLKKNNIEVIRPVPHDAFNPREHEILMAESNADFKKGEIVKMMNSGYRQKDVILLRANVIAAR